MDDIDIWSFFMGAIVGGPFFWAFCQYLEARFSKRTQACYGCGAQMRLAPPGSFCDECKKVHLLAQSKRMGEEAHLR